MTISERQRRLRAWIGEAERVVFLTGAGISTESGIPDFRGPGGIYSDPEAASVFEIEAFRRDPARFYRFAARFLPLMEQSRPNRAHRAIARLQDGRRVAVVTQNIDGLHRRAGSSALFCVHGDFDRLVCLGCGQQAETADYLVPIKQGEVPRHECGGTFKPTVTFFGEALPAGEWEGAARAIAAAQVLVIVGSSLTVYPAATLPDYRPDDSRLVIINREPTPRDREADLLFREGAGDVLEMFL